MKIKYPKTFHLPFSLGISNDDKVIKSLNGFVGHEISVTEKMDGENSTLYRDTFHARSLDSRHHPSRDWLKKFHGEMAYKIPEDWRICGENMYARHSIVYENLESFFYGFSIWNEKNVALSIDEQNQWFDEFSIVQPRQLYRGRFDLKTLHDIAAHLDTSMHEGFVVRVVDEIPFEDFDKKVAKWVRRGHVQTDEHWMFSNVVPNRLAD